MDGARLMKGKERIVNQVTLPGEIFISTVFLGLDHRYSGTGPPIVFETMVFGGPNDGYQERCCTWREAKAMHRRVVNMHVGRLKVVKSGRKQAG
jgi:hypothetical protein